MVVPVVSEAAARVELERLRRRHLDASHVCWALRLGAGTLERAADAGEPAGTAGEPMLRVLRGAGWGDALGVVIRWFGGTKLGRGGLVRAYSGALREAMTQAATRRVVPRRRFRIVTDYARHGAVEHLLRGDDVVEIASRFGIEVERVVEVPADRVAAWRAALRDLGVEAETVR